MRYERKVTDKEPVTVGMRMDEPTLSALYLFVSSLLTVIMSVHPRSRGRLFTLFTSFLNSCREPVGPEPEGHDNGDNKNPRPSRMLFPSPCLHLSPPVVRSSSVCSGRRRPQVVTVILSPVSAV